MISFRITFTDDVCSKFNMVNYKNFKGKCIAYSEGKQVVVQIDSLHKFTGGYTEVLVFDDIESILEQLHNCSQNVKIFLNFIKNAKRVIVMNGLMENKTVVYLLHFR